MPAKAIRTAVRPACTLIMILVMQLTSAAEDADNDLWFAYVRDGVRYGHEHVTKTRESNGHLRIKVDTRVLTELLNQKQESVETETWIVTPDCRPVSVEKSVRQLSGKTTLTGRLDGDNMLLDRQSGDIHRSNRVPLTARTIASICIPEWLSRQPADVAECSADVINLETLNVEPARFKRLTDPDGSTRWESDRHIGSVVTHGHIDLDGAIRLREDFDVPRFSLVRCTEAEARDISHFRYEGRELLMFPVNKDIARPDLLTSMTVRLTWNGIALDKFNLEDERQKVISHTEQDGQHAAVVRISSVDDTDLESPVSFPIDDDNFESQLQESLYIKPANEKIVAQAREWTQGSTDAIAAVKSLSRHISEFMNGGTMITETLSGPEVLQCRQGKCSEYSTLFASLARSLGIPTRIVLGDRLIGGYWVGHMWNEAWVGKWITVDTTTNEVGSASALVKFVHSDSVMGTQHLRWALVESLEIAIRDFDVRSSGTAAAWQTGVAGRAYSNADFHCRIFAPGDDWKIEEKSAAGQVVVRLHVPGQDNVLLHFVPYSLPLPLPAKTILGIRQSRFATTYKGYKILDERVQTLNEREWHVLQFRRDAAKPEVEKNGSQNSIKTTEFVWHKGTAGFLVNLIGEESAHDGLLADLQSIVSSFEMNAQDEGDK